MRELVVAVVDRRQQRRPAVFRRLVDVGAGLDERLGRLEVAFARREDQRRQSAAATADQTCDDHFRVVGLVASLRIGRRLLPSRRFRHSRRFRPDGPDGRAPCALAVSAARAGTASTTAWRPLTPLSRAAAAGAAAAGAAACPG